MLNLFHRILGWYSLGRKIVRVNKMAKKINRKKSNSNSPQFLSSFLGMRLIYRILIILLVLGCFLFAIYSVIIRNYLTLSDQVLTSANKYCLQITQDNTKEGFQILESHTDDNYSLFTAKITLRLRYNNGLETYVDCIFRKHLVGPKVQIDRVNLVNENGVVHIRKNISFYINK